MFEASRGQSPEHRPSVLAIAPTLVLSQWSRRASGPPLGQAEFYTRSAAVVNRKDLAALR